MGLQSQGSQPLHIGGQLLRGRWAIQPDVHLHPYTMDRDTLLNQAFHQVVDGLRLGVQPFPTMVVVDKNGIRIGFMRPLEGKRDIFRADHAQPVIFV